MCHPHFHINSTKSFNQKIKLKRPVKNLKTSRGS
jgi:hypothetical protein